MTPLEIRERVARIEGMKGDDEAAHTEEDDLWSDVLTAIASGACHSPGACAAEAIKTKAIRFSRWCA
jgi:hypothetical protein